MAAPELVLTRNIRADREPMTLAEYEAAGGYQAVRQALAMTPQEVQGLVAQSKLRGRGGAGFSAGTKWGAVPMGPAARQPKYVVVNADEMEPGANKDRLLMEGDPHQLLEGTMIAAYAIGAREAFIFVRWAYRLAARRLVGALTQAYARGYLGQSILGSDYSLDIRVHLSAGRYMCGEADGMLGALEGQRAVPRSKPPYATTCGLWGQPTVVNNVETLCCVPHIVLNGPEWFRGLGRGSDAGTKVFSVSGRVKRPGLWELPMGTPMREIIEVYAGGMMDGYELRAVLPGGGSTPFVTAEHLDTPMDFEAMEAVGSRVGTGTMIVLDDRTCPVGVVQGLMQFFARESCGWCTPCREGLPWVARTLEALEEGTATPADLPVLAHHVAQIRMGHTFCALAPGAMMPLESALKLFGGTFETHVAGRCCPWSRPCPV